MQTLQGSLPLQLEAFCFDRYFVPEYHFFMLKNNEELELRIYKNGVRVSQKDLMTTKRGSKILREYLNEQQIKESKG